MHGLDTEKIHLRTLSTLARRKQMNFRGAQEPRASPGFKSRVLDKIDNKILKELLENSRTHLSKTGQKVRLSRENVHYRIQSLIKRGVLRDFVTVIDYKKLGFSLSVVLTGDDS